MYAFIKSRRVEIHSISGISSNGTVLLIFKMKVLYRLSLTFHDWMQVLIIDLDDELK